MIYKVPAPSWRWENIHPVEYPSPGEQSSFKHLSRLLHWFFPQLQFNNTGSYCCREVLFFSKAQTIYCNYSEKRWNAEVILRQKMPNIFPNTPSSDFLCFVRLGVWCLRNWVCQTKRENMTLDIEQKFNQLFSFFILAGWLCLQRKLNEILPTSDGEGGSGSITVEFVLHEDASLSLSSISQWVYKMRLIRL